MKKYILAMDQGTTSCRSILFDRQGAICSMAQKEFKQIYPQPGWVDHDPVEIRAAQLSVSVEAMQLAGAKAQEIAAIGITNQRETTVVWNRHTGKPVYNAIVWQCRRTAGRIDCLKADGLSDYVREVTGLIPDAYFSASKIAWILENAEGARAAAEAGDLLFGTVDTWLLWSLTGGQVHATDYTNACRTMLYDIHNLCWDERLLSYFGIPQSMLPAVQASGSYFGETVPELFGAPIPLTGVAGDQQAALFGQCCFEPGDAKNTYGTGCFMLMNTGEQAVRSDSGLLTTIAATAEKQPVQYALEGSVFIAGASIQWLRDEMGLIRDGKDAERYALSVEDTNGVYVVPAFTGLGAPYWDPYARGTIVGLTRGSGRAHLVRAVLESMAYQTSDILELMEAESGVRLRGLRVDGGASQNRFLVQFQADILDRTVYRPACIETTALGAAYLAGLTAGFWESLDEVRQNCVVGQTFRPSMRPERREALKKGWKRAVERSLHWAEE